MVGPPQIGSQRSDENSLAPFQEHQAEPSFPVPLRAKPLKDPLPGLPARRHPLPGGRAVARAREFPAARRREKVEKILREILGVRGGRLGISAPRPEGRSVSVSRES